MIQYERIDNSKGIDFNKTNSSKECMICHYWYFDAGFEYQPYGCNAWHGFNMTVQNVSDFFIAIVKKADYGYYAVGIKKKMQLIC